MSIRSIRDHSNSWSQKKKMNILLVERSRYMSESKSSQRSRRHQLLFRKLKLFKSWQGRNLFKIKSKIEEIKTTKLDKLVLEEAEVVVEMEIDLQDLSLQLKILEFLKRQKKQVRLTHLTRNLRDKKDLRETMILMLHKEATSEEEVTEEILEGIEVVTREEIEEATREEIEEATREEIGEATREEIEEVIKEEGTDLAISKQEETFMSMKTSMTSLELKYQAKGKW